MRETRIINRIMLGIGMFAALIALCAEMETLTTAQFIVAKLAAALFGWAIVEKARELDRKNEI